jgi:hypothetical protein
MASRRSTVTASVGTEAKHCLRSGQVELLAWFNPAEDRKGLCLLLMSGAVFRRSSLRRRNDYVSARAEARSNSNVGQGHARAVAFYWLRFVATPWRASAGYHAGTVAPSRRLTLPSRGCLKGCAF